MSLLCTNFTLPFFQKNQLFWSFFVPFVFLFLAILLRFSKEVKSVWFLRNISSSFKISTITFGLFTLTQIKYKVFILQNDDVSLLCTNFTHPFFQKNQLFWSFFVPFVFLFLAILLRFSKEVKSVWFLRNISSSFKISTITFGLFTLTQIKYKVFILQNDDVSLLCTNFTRPFFSKEPALFVLLCPFRYSALATFQINIRFIPLFLEKNDDEYATHDSSKWSQQNKGAQ